MKPPSEYLFRRHPERAQPARVISRERRSHCHRERPQRVEGSALARGPAPARGRV